MSESPAGSGFRHYIYKSYRQIRNNRFHKLIAGDYK